MSAQEIKLKLLAYDHRMLDKSTEEIVHTVKRTGAKIKGLVPLPTDIERFSVNKSPHIDKKSQDQWEQRTHVRLLIIVEPLPQTMDALMKLDLPAGIEVAIKFNVGSA